MGILGGTAIANAAGPLTFFVMVIGSPVSEELFFRGWGLAWLRESVSPGVAILLSALLFSMVHINPVQLPLTFVGGLLGAWLVVKTRSLVPYLICHALNNFYTFLMLYFQSKKASPASSGLNSPIYHGVWPSLFCVLSGLLLWGVFKAIRQSIQNDRLVSSQDSSHAPSVQ